MHIVVCFSSDVHKRRLLWYNSRCQRGSLKKKQTPSFGGEDLTAGKELTPYIWNIEQRITFLLNIFFGARCQFFHTRSLNVSAVLCFQNLLFYLLNNSAISRESPSRGKLLKTKHTVHLSNGRQMWRIYFRLYSKRANANTNIYIYIYILNVYVCV